MIPVGAWLEQPLNATAIGYDTAMGNNIYWSIAGKAGNPQDPVADFDVIRANGMHVIAPYDDANTGSETVGWQGYDESDGLGAGSGPWKTSSGCTSGSCGYTTAKFYYAGKTTNVSGDTTLPYSLDGRVINQGFTWPVLWTYTDAQAKRFLSYSDILSADSYWITNAMQGTSAFHACGIGNTGIAVAATACHGSNGLTPTEAALPANYGWNVTRLRALQAKAGSAKPVIFDVETSCPGTTYRGLGNCTAPPEVVAAVWHGFIAGARGVAYFQHGFAGPCGGYATFYGGSDPSSTEYNCRLTPSNANLPPGASAYTLHQMIQTVTRVNHEIDSLNHVLLSPTAVGEVSTVDDVSVMAKAAYKNTACYVFAGSGQPFKPPAANQSVTFHLANNYTGTVKPVDGEGRALNPVTVRNGTFSDTFANENSIHIYDIPATC